MHQNIRRNKIIGSRRFSNYFWAGFLLLGGIGFLLAGFSSFAKINFLPFTDSTKLTFVPQGLLMIFYGTLSLAISVYIFATVFLDIGSGYNEYNKSENLIKIVRKGFPGRSRNLFLTYPLTSARAIGIKITPGLNAKQNIYLCLKDQRNIPLTPAQEPMSVSNLEEEAAELARFLDLKLENL